MTKHIHIHLHRTPAKARDAGWDESKHKRNHGQFSTTSGDAAHHEAAAAKHDETRQGLPSMHDDKHHHLKASMRHEEAAQYLKSAANAKAAGNHDLAAEHHKTAEQLAQHAKQHEAQLSTHQKPAAKPQANSSGVPVKHQPSGTVVKHQAPKHNPLFDRPKPGGKEPTDAEMKAHPNYSKEDHDYFKGKGWSNSEIHQRWTAENSAGKPAQQVNKHNAPLVRYDNGNRPIK